MKTKFKTLKNKARRTKMNKNEPVVAPITSDLSLIKIVVKGGTIVERIYTSSQGMNISYFPNPLIDKVA